ITPRDKLRAAKLNDAITGSIITHERRVVIAAQEFKVSDLEARLGSEQAAPSLLPGDGGLFEQRLRFVGPVEFDEDIRATEINISAHRLVTHACENFVSPVVVLERLLVAVEHVVDRADVGLKLRDL